MKCGVLPHFLTCTGKCRSHNPSVPLRHRHLTFGGLVGHRPGIQSTHGRTGPRDLSKDVHRCHIPAQPPISRASCSPGVHAQGRSESMDSAPDRLPGGWEDGKYEPYV